MPRRKRPDPPPKKTPFEKWVSSQGAIIWRLLLFIPVAYLIVNFITDRFSDAVQIGVFTALVAAFIYIILGKWPLK